MSTSTISKNNYSITPLNVGGAFLGNWDSVLPYSSAIITINSDQNCQLTIFTAMNTLNPIVNQYNTTANVPYVLELPLNYPYIKTYLINSASNNQTFLNFEIIYREQVIQIPQSETETNVNLNQVGGTPFHLGATGASHSLPVVITSDQGLIGITGSVICNLTKVGSANVVLGQTGAVGSIPVTLANDRLVGITGSVNQGTTPWVSNITQVNGSTLSLGQTAMVNSVPVTLATNQSNVNVDVVSFPSTNTGGTLWSANVTSNTNTSAIINMTGAFKNTYTLFASTDNACTLTVQYSPDGSTWFNTTNVLILPLGASGVLDWQTSSGYIRLIASGIASTSIITSYLNHV